MSGFGFTNLLGVHFKRVYQLTPRLRNEYLISLTADSYESLEVVKNMLFKKQLVGDCLDL